MMMMIIKGSARKGWKKRAACCGRDPNWYAAVSEYLVTASSQWDTSELVNVIKT